jgi:phosphoribosylformylglycinamidine (FGAM) synthase PurS component
LFKDTNSEETVPDIIPTDRVHTLIYNEVNDLQIKRSQQLTIENDGKNQIDQLIRNIESELRCNICFDIFTKVIF